MCIDLISFDFFLVNVRLNRRDLRLHRDDLHLNYPDSHLNRVV